MKTGAERKPARFVSALPLGGAPSLPGEGERAALRMTRLCAAVRRAAGHIHLVDQCLLLFMAVLMLQSAAGLFLPGERGGESDSIDVIVRTSSAAVFGYILSANFNRCASASKAAGGKAKEVRTTGAREGPVAQIGFQAPAEESGESLERTEPGVLREEDAQAPENRLQIVTATVIGLFCLLTLLLLRWLGIPERGSAAVVQFRDFVSGCVGFLIGCPTQKSN